MENALGVIRVALWCDLHKHWIFSPVFSVGRMALVGKENRNKYKKSAKYCVK